MNSGKFKIMDIAAIVGHTSPQMIMTRYAGFIKENHLKIDTNLEIFSDSFGDSFIIVSDLHLKD
jgi:integrase